MAKDQQGKEAPDSPIDLTSPRAAMKAFGREVQENDKPDIKAMMKQICGKWGDQIPMCKSLPAAPTKADGQKMMGELAKLHMNSAIRGRTGR